MPKPSPKRAETAKTRSPKGVLVRSPVALRLFPEELERLKAGACREMRTDAAFARLCFLHGLKAYEGGKKLSA